MPAKLPRSASWNIEEGIFKQELATLEGELKLAESDWQRAQDAVEGTKARLTRLKFASKGTAADVAAVYDGEDRVVDADRREPKVKLALEQVKTKLKLLRQYTKPKVVKELQANLEKLRADEFVKKANWELEKSKEVRLGREPNARRPRHRAGSRVLVLTRALSVEEKIRSGVEGLRKEGSFDANRGEATRELVSQLEKLVEQTEAELAMLRVDRLKAAIDQAAAHVRAAPRPLRLRAPIALKTRPAPGRNLQRSGGLSI